MKQLGAVLVVLLVATVGISTATAAQTATTAICHKTSSKTKPYVRLKLSGKKLKAHLGHASDIIPAPKGACPQTLLTAATGGTAFDVSLTGEAESPAGDPVATGTATVRLRAGQAQACYQVAGTNLPAAVAAHIHSGAAGASGPVVIPLLTPGADGKASGCVPAPRAVVAAILASPDAYYVNVHTQEFGGGAIRGQLTGTSPTAFGWIAAFNLQPSTEPNAKGTAVIRIRKDAGLVCFRLHAEGITLPSTNAHIHRGAATVNGPVVVPLVPPAATGNSDGCVQSTPAVIDEIIGNPANFYVNVHTTEHPAGAMRGQLG